MINPILVAPDAVFLYIHGNIESNPGVPTDKHAIGMLLFRVDFVDTNEPLIVQIFPIFDVHG